MTITAVNGSGRPTLGCKTAATATSDTCRLTLDNVTVVGVDLVVDDCHVTISGSRPFPVRDHFRSHDRVLFATISGSRAFPVTRPFPVRDHFRFATISGDVTISGHVTISGSRLRDSTIHTTRTCRSLRMRVARTNWTFSGHAPCRHATEPCRRALSAAYCYRHHTWRGLSVCVARMLCSCAAYCYTHHI